jgi:hypothetical protein
MERDMKRKKKVTQEEKEMKIEAKEMRRTGTHKERR